MENDDKSLINKLQGHSVVVKDVGFNYDQSLLASGDMNVRGNSGFILFFLMILKVIFEILLLFFLHIKGNSYCMENKQPIVEIIQESSLNVQFIFVIVICKCTVNIININYVLIGYK